MALAEVADEHGFRVEMIDRDVEKSLDLRRVKVHREDSVDAGGGQQVRHQFGGDRYARLVLPVLACVAEERHHRGDPLRAGTARSIHHDQQLHDVVIGRRAAGLDDENIGAADVFVDFHFGFSVRKGGDVDVGQRLSEVFCDAFGKRAVSGSTDDFHEKKER